MRDVTYDGAQIWWRRNYDSVCDSRVKCKVQLVFFT